LFFFGLTQLFLVLFGWLDYNAEQDKTRRHFPKVLYRNYSYSLWSQSG
jgi:hypothetical protein